MIKNLLLFILFSSFSFGILCQLNFIDSSNNKNWIIDFTSDMNENIFMLNAHKKIEPEFGFNTTYKLSIKEFNSKNKLIWEKDILKGYNISSALIKVNSKNELIIVGSFQKNIDSIGDERTFSYSRGVSDIFILKLDKSGNKILFKTFGSKNFMSQVGQIEIDNNDNIFISGITSDRVNFGLKIVKESSVDGIMEPPKRNRFIAKFNSDCSSGWIKKYDDYYSFNYINNKQSTEDFKYADFLTIFINKLNEILITGRQTTSIKTDDFNISPFPKTSNIIIDKLNEEGKIIFKKRFEGDYISEGRSIKTDNDGNIYLTGIFYSKINFGKDTLTSTPEHLTDSYIVKLSNEGDIIWVRDISFNNATTSSHHLEIYKNKIVVVGNLLMD